MPIRYFDLNGATAGFSTLTGAWDTSSTFWSSSSLGNVATYAATGANAFTAADTAQFGATGTSATAGVATIATGNTVTLNCIRVQNLAGQNILAAGTGNLVFALDGATVPTLDLQNAGTSGNFQLVLGAPINGASGLTIKKDASTSYRLVQFGNPSHGLSGTLTIENQYHDVDITSENIAGTPSIGLAFPNISLFSLVGCLAWTPNASFAFNSGQAFSGLGALWIGGSGNTAVGQTGAVTFPAGALAGLTGTRAPSAHDSLYGGQVRANSGLSINCSATSARFLQTNVKVQDLPRVLSFLSFTNGATANRAECLYEGDSLTSTTDIAIIATGNFPAFFANFQPSLYANGTGPLTINGGITRAGFTGAVTFRVRGTNTGNNTISGAIEDTLASSALSIRKEDAGRWVFSGSSTYTGTTTVAGGTLSAQSATALGSSAGSVTVDSGATLELAGGITLNKSSTGLTLHTSSPITSTGDNSIQFATLALAGTTTFTVGSSNALRLLNSGAISGSAGITKAGDGELELGTGASTYTGTCTVSAGTLTVKSLNNLNANGVFGNSTNRVALTGALKFAGSSAGTTDKVELQGSAPTLDASGTSNATATFTSLSQTAVARTLTLTGTGEGIISSPLSNNGGGAVGVTKAGAGLWRLTGALGIGGAVAVDNGRMRVETATSNASMASAVTVGASGILELVTNELASSSGTAGRVIGTGNVTVSGEIKTRGGTTQKGQVRYGGNLTFQAGSKLYIGGAAA